MTAPATLGHAGIAQRIPHAGRMCLLDALHSWTADGLHCSATGHAALDHPLRSAGGLLAPCAIEYAAQAMALHGALLGSLGDGLAQCPVDGPAHGQRHGPGDNPPDGPRRAPGAAPQPGYLASVRAVRLHVASLHGLPGPLAVRVQRLAGDAQQILYQFSLHDGAGRPVADGRATVVLNTPLALLPARAPSAEP